MVTKERKRKINIHTTRKACRINSVMVRNVERSSRDGVSPSGLRFIISGNPVAKGRPRFMKGKIITPKRTLQYEKLVASCAMEAYSALPFEQRIYWPTLNQVFLDLWLYHSKKRGSKPDPDNVSKAIADGLTGVLWFDDIHVLPRINKDFWYDNNPRVEVFISFTGYVPGRNGLDKCESKKPI